MTKLIIPLIFLLTLSYSEAAPNTSVLYGRPYSPTQAQDNSIPLYKTLIFLGLLTGFIPVVVLSTVTYGIYLLLKFLFFHPKKPPEQKPKITQENYHSTLIDELEDDS